MRGGVKCFRYVPSMLYSVGGGYYLVVGWLLVCGVLLNTIDGGAFGLSLQAFTVCVVVSPVVAVYGTTSSFSQLEIA